MWGGGEGGGEGREEGRAASFRYGHIIMLLQPVFRRRPSPDEAGHITKPHVVAAFSGLLVRT